MHFVTGVKHYSVACTVVGYGQLFIDASSEESCSCHTVILVVLGTRRTGTTT